MTIASPIPSPITFRPGHMDDNRALFRIESDAIDDLVRRIGLVASDAPASTDEEFQAEWEETRSLSEHLARCAEFFWVAEREGEIVGFARTCSHDGVRELTELFVHPSAQSQGVGKELLSRAFPREDVRRRIIIATAETAAQTLYMRSGVYARHTIYRIGRAPQTREIISDLQFDPVPNDIGPNNETTLAYLATIDRAILDFQREADHQWLLSQRQAWLYRRGGEVVGYGYTGKRNGPFALLNGEDFPTVIAHAENLAAAAGHEEFSLWVPSINRHVIDYLLAERYRVARFVTALLSDEPFGKLEYYINTNPPLFL